MTNTTWILDWLENVKNRVNNQDNRDMVVTEMLDDQTGRITYLTISSKEYWEGQEKEKKHCKELQEIVDRSDLYKEIATLEIELAKKKEELIKDTDEKTRL